MTCRAATWRLVGASKGSASGLTTTVRLPVRCSRAFSNNNRLRAEEDDAQKPSPSPSLLINRTSGPVERTSPSLHPNAKRNKGMAGLASSFAAMLPPNGNQAGRSSLIDSFTTSNDSLYPMGDSKDREPHHFHIYATKQNTHITLTKPSRDPILSVSCGSIGFTKAGRKQYDSSYQLASYVMSRMQEQGINAQIKQLEVTLRGFGPGREAVTKALMGQEGRFLRGKVVKLSDATRLKFGGTRSPNPRRLG